MHGPAHARIHQRCAVVFRADRDGLLRLQGAGRAEEHGDGYGATNLVAHGDGGKRVFEDEKDHFVQVDLLLREAPEGAIGSDRRRGKEVQEIR